MVKLMLLLDKVGIWTKPVIQNISTLEFVLTRNGVGGIDEPVFAGGENLMLKKHKLE